MLHLFARTRSAVLIPLLFVLTVASGEGENPKTPPATSGASEQEIDALKIDQGAVLRVTIPLRKEQRGPDFSSTGDPGDPALPEIPVLQTMRHPREARLRRGRAFRGDLRTLPLIRPRKRERPEFVAPVIIPVPLPGTQSEPSSSQGNETSNTPSPSSPAPAASMSFEGLDFANWGAGHPPDTNGDVGPQYYIQTINTSVGIYNKSDGSRVTAFIFNTLMSQGTFGNLCDTANFGDPVVLYDTFEDRWIITDFAFNLSGGSPVAPEFQCFAVSKSGDPVTGGWNFYSIQVNGGFGDYPKFGIWPDGLYMSANVFGFGAGGAFQNARVWALNKSQMYAGASTVQVLSFDAPAAEFSLLPSNARLQTGTPPPGSPNYFSVVAQFLNTVSVYKFHADWNSLSTSTFTGPFLSLTSTSWSQLLAANQTEQSPGNKLDTLYFRLMMQNQYTNIGGVESLWNTHTVGASGATSSQAAVRYYEVRVTGGTVEANASQAFTYSPDATVFRFMPSVAVDRIGNMAIGYSATNATLNPAIRYAGRFASDPINSITETEQSLIEGTGTQSGNCGSSCTRWGDYSAMTLDPDGCTFWFTSMYYQTTGLAFNTRTGAFTFPGCTPAIAGAVQGTVTATGSENPISGALIALGSRTTTTDTNGAYSFPALPSGTYPGMTASFAGYNSSSVTTIVVTDGLATTQDFALTTASTSGCLTDTSQADFQTGTPTNLDLTSSPGDVTLSNASTLDQSNTAGTTTGTSFATTSWGGQTFIPAVTGTLVRADVQLFCSGCTGTTPNLTLSVRSTSGGLPSGADLAFATIPGFSSGAGVYYTVSFGSPATLTAGTQYALILRPVSAPSAGGYFWIRSSPSTYPNGQRVISTNNGATWTADSTRDFNFRAYMQTGFALSGTFVSSLKDANPDPLSGAQWGTISWNADTPAGTAVQFQAAASNNAGGPFNFVGPDNTVSTFFGSGASLSQFNGSRYLRYQATLTTTASNVAPSLHDVTICFNDVSNALSTTLAVSPATGIYGDTTTLTATLSAGSSGVSGRTVSFTLSGNDLGSATTDSSGLATVPGVSLAKIDAGDYPSAVGATFAGDSSYLSTSGTGSLTVSKAGQTITFDALPNKNFGDADFGVSATASSSLGVAFDAAGNCSVLDAIVHLTGGGSCTITASQAGDTNYNAAPGVPQTFSVAKSTQTITFGALTSKNFGDADFGVSATASSSLAVSFTGTGNCSVTGSTVHLTGAGSCTITASQDGDSDYAPASDVPQLFTIVKASQTITFGPLGSKHFGDVDFALSATASSSLVVSFAATGNCSVTGSTVHLSGAGSCTITASQSGDSDYASAPDVPQLFAIAKASQTITFGALASKHFGDADFALSATASSNLSVSFSGSGNCSVTGLSVHLTGAGSCTITASQSGDSNYAPASDVSQPFAISKALPIVSLTCPPAPYDVNTHPCTVAITGIGNATVNGNTTVTYNSNATPPANAGVYGVDASFTSSDNNYTDASGTGSLTIARATPTVNVLCPSGVVFDGSPHTCSAGAVGVGNTTVSGSSVLAYNGGAAPSSAGTYPVSASFTSTDLNYADNTGTGSLTIAKASQTIAFSALGAKTLGDPDFAVAATASSSLVVAFSATGNCTVTATTVHLSAAGSCTITAAQNGDMDFSPAISVGRTFTINPGDNFSIAVTLHSVTVTAGQSATDHITITPSPATITALHFTCSGLPAKASCTFLPDTIPAGSAQTDVVVTVSTTAATTAQTQHQPTLYGAMRVISLGLAGILIVGVRRRGHKKGVILSTLVLLTILTAVSCGGRSQVTPGTPGTPHGTSTVTVTGSTTGFSHSTSFTLTVN